MNTAHKLTEHISIDMRNAMKAGERSKAETLKALLARFSNAEAVPADQYQNSTEVARKILTLDDLYAIIDDEIKELQQAASTLPSSSKYRVELEQKTAILLQYRQTI